MLNCRWSLENERSFIYWGGVSADPVVSAVLGAIGKQYLVEHQEAEDGSWWYDRYSDGFIRLIITQHLVGSGITVTFPIAFTKQPVVVGIPEVNSDQYIMFSHLPRNVTTTGFTINGASAMYNFIVEGY